MNRNKIKSVTLIELIIALTIFTMVILGFLSIDVFSRYQLLSSDRRAKLQNEAAFILDHMTKTLSTVIGSVVEEPVNLTQVSGTTQQVIGFIDNGSGIRSTNANVSYCYNTTSCQAGTYILSFQRPAGTGAVETLSTHVNFFSANLVNRNQLNVNISLCWDPDNQPHPCGTMDNPAISMNTTIRFPGVSIN
ncbi:MAG: prepilin-type N-terminal cleavage/methylation domain-containing protein [Candidatus Omnitrophica bacterium]|nr:prepilin-type N-terminal cleavage/methylation domain-containing protein [Candidatus Omnitrophota bacterium]